MSTDRHARNDGFMLITVLWVIALLTMLLTGFMRSTSTQSTITRNIVAAAHAEGLADAGVNMAILDLLAARQSNATLRGTSVNATPQSCSAGPGETITIAIQDAGGRVDLNAAGPSLLAAFFAGLGMTAVEANAAAAAVIDFRDRDTEALPGGAEAADYTASGLSHRPKNAPFDTVDELERVFGVNAAIAERAYPHITVDSGAAAVDPTASTAELATILATGRALLVATGARARDQDVGTLPGEFAGPAARKTFYVRAEGRVGEGVFAREAVVDLGGRRTQIYGFRSWRQGERTVGDVAPSGTLPPCTGVIGSKGA